MCVAKEIHLEGYTDAQCRTLALNAIGMPVKEIADHLGVTTSTAQTHMKNSKEKSEVGVDKELTARWLCNYFGKDYDEVKKQIIAYCLLFVFLLYVPIHTEQRRADRIRVVARQTVSCRRNDFV